MMALTVCSASALFTAIPVSEQWVCFDLWLYQSAGFRYSQRGSNHSMALSGIPEEQFSLQCLDVLEMPYFSQKD
jgi:hypothetical protein